MSSPSRRTFLRDVSTGMLIAAAGPLAPELGFSIAFADEGPESLSFGRLEPLVHLMQETPLSRLQPLLVGKLKRGDARLSDLIGAAALANAQTLGGEDYVGYHNEMALTPALEMAKRLPKEQRPLPVLKVIYRNSARLQEVGKRESLKQVKFPRADGRLPTGDELREAVRKGDMNQAEQVFAAVCQAPLKDAYNRMQPMVQDLPMVHRVVLAHRSWELANLLGPDHAHTLLRQALRYCVREENGFNKDHPYRNIRKLVPKALDQYRLLERGPGKRQPDDAWIETLADTIYRSSREEAIDVTAGALAEGMVPDAVAEALVLAASRLILCQDIDGERGKHTHGNSVGIHCCDAMNAWRHIARECDHANGTVSLLVGSFFVAGDSAYKQPPFPHAEHVKEIQGKNAEALLNEFDEAVRDNDQGRASAAVARYAEGGYPERAVFDRMLRFTVSEDGRLHGEKYFRTATEEFTRARPTFRWRHAISLARVTASAYGLNPKDEPGHRAPGYEEACRLLRLPKPD